MLQSLGCCFSVCKQPVSEPASLQNQMTNIDVILQIYGHFISFWHLDKLLQMLQMRCDRHWLKGPARTAVTVDHNTPRHCFLWDKDKGLVYRGETLWFWLSLLLDLGVLLPLMWSYGLMHCLKMIWGGASVTCWFGKCFKTGSFHLLNSF